MVAFKISAALLAFTACVAPSPTSGALSVPSTSAKESASLRIAAVTQAASQISNGPRSLRIAGVDYPFYHGPQAGPGSMAFSIRMQEVDAIMSFRTDYPAFLGGLIAKNAPKLASMEAIVSLYDQADAVLEKPMAMDNSDETFGLQRVTVKTLALRELTASEFKKTPLSLSDTQLRRLCGGGKHATAKEFQAKHALFVEDFSTVAQWNDAKRPIKYVPNVVGVFCVNRDSHKLRPIEIRLLDTKLTYTPLDTADEWTLAKMALESTSVAYHQMQHLAETHAVTVPLRVEMIRTMAADHPVQALLFRHVFSDFGLELQATSLLLNTSTVVDETFGWGASGATQFLHAATTSGVSMKTKAFHSDIHARGLHHIKKHKYAVYGSLYWTAINDFVGKFLDVYYESNAAVQVDSELQNWAKASAKIPHVKDWPSSFTTKDQLRDLLTELIFQSTVKHHVSSGEATWQSAVPPYSAAALWKPLPTAKLQANESLNLIQYTVPITVLPTALIASALFIRPVPAGQNLFNAYTVEPFVSEPALQPAIEAFTQALVDIETAITKGEAGEKWPYSVMLPAHLPCFTWI